MKKIKYLILLIIVFIGFPFNVFATSTLAFEINAQKEGENSLWQPIYVSDIDEDKSFDIYDVATYKAKNNSLTFNKDGNLLSFSNDSYDDKYILTDYNNTISSLELHHGGKTYIGGRGKLKVEKSNYVYYNYYANVRIEKDGYTKFLNDENGNMYHTENLGIALYNANLDNTDFQSKAESIIKNEWSNLQKWNSDIIGDKPFNPSYVYVRTNDSTMNFEEKYADEELVKTYINTNLDVTYLSDGVLFDGSKVLEDNGIVFKSEDVLPDDYKLEAKDIYDDLEEEKEEHIEETIEENKMMIGLFDISVNNGVTQVDIDSGKYTIRVPITDNIKNYTGYYVVYVKNGEVVDTIDAKIIDGKYIEFDTTHLSEYGIIADLLKGDLNNNSKVDLKDIISLIKKYLGTDNTSSKDVKVGDMNNNSKIDLKDIILLIKKYLGSE